MQEINSPEEIDIFHRLEHLKSQHSRLGKHLTALENLSYLYRVIQNIYESFGSKIKEFLSKSHLFFQSNEVEKNCWQEELGRKVKMIKNQIKELQLQKDTILYPDSEEHSVFFRI